MHRFPDHDTLLRFVRRADAAISAAGLGGAVLHVDDLAPADRCFRWHGLDGSHPLDVLLGFVAPAHWRAIGVSCSGVSRRLDGTPSDPDAVMVTALLDRSGDVASVIRRGDDVTVMPAPLEGAVVDACRPLQGFFVNNIAWRTGMGGSIASGFLYDGTVRNVVVLMGVFGMATFLTYLGRNLILRV